MSELKVSVERYVKGLNKAIEKLREGIKALKWLKENGDYGHIDWITSQDGWDRDICIYRAKSNLEELRKSYIRALVKQKRRENGDGSKD